MAKVLFTHLTKLEGILEHLEAYMIKDPMMSDPEHYHELRKGVQLVIDTLTTHLEDERVVH